MTLESIFQRIDKPKRYRLAENAHESICHIISEKNEYIIPDYNELSSRSDARFVIFSAPGAAGKTALAEHIAYQYNAIYWNLARIRLGDNTFKGTIYDAIADNEPKAFYYDLACGKTMIVIDAFDEAEMISGKFGVMALLKDLISVTEGSIWPTVVLLSRTDTANEICKYLEGCNALYSRYEIGFITEEYAKRFVLNIALKRHGNRDIVLQCINQQFSAIRNILGEERNIKSFLGYPPVLQALGMAYDQDNNTYKLLKRYQSDGTARGAILIRDILSSLLDREHEKVIKALEQRWADKYPDFQNWDGLFTPEEQIVKIMEYIVLGSIDLYSDDGDNLAEDMRNDYYEVLRTFIPQNPFIVDTAERGVTFAGPAFRDYILAYMMSHEEYRDLVDEYLSNNYWVEVPSSLLFDFYTFYKDSVLSGSYFPYIYESFKANDKKGMISSVTVISDSDLCTGYCCTYSSKKIAEGSYERPLQEEIIRIEKDFQIVRFNNSKIDVDGVVTIGSGDGSSTILDSSVECGKVIFNTNELEITSEKNICMLVSRTDITLKGSEPTFKFYPANKDNIHISASNIDRFYLLRQYKFDSNHLNTNKEKMLQFCRTIDKIFDCMRKHRKDTPAKDREYIDNEIITKNEFKQQILNFLLKKKILYIDPQESHLYKLNRENVRKYGIGWQIFIREGEKPFEQLFNEFEHEMSLT